MLLNFVNFIFWTNNLKIGHRALKYVELCKWVTFAKAAQVLEGILTTCVMSMNLSLYCKHVTIDQNKSVGFVEPPSVKHES